MSEDSSSEAPDLTPRRSGREKKRKSFGDEGGLSECYSLYGSGAVVIFDA